MTQKLIETSHGAIALDDNGGSGLPLLMIHANSCCKEEFVFQTRALGDIRRVIALDLPGHGNSLDAIDPRRTYTVSGYADAVLEVLGKLEVRRFAVLGHSLGGHVALELIAQGGNVAGAMIFGTPPIPNSLEGLQLGFIPSPEMAYTGNPVLTEEEARGVVRLALGPSAERDIFYTSAVQRTDGRARQYMLEAVVAGQEGDQREVVATSTVPLAVVNGADDPVVNLDYVDSLITELSGPLCLYAWPMPDMVSIDSNLPCSTSCCRASCKRWIEQNEVYRSVGPEFANTRLRAIRKSRMIIHHDARQVRPRQGCGQPREAPVVAGLWRSYF